MTTHILAEESNDERERTLMRTLAHRFLSQAVREAEEGNGTIAASNRQIGTFDDRCLLLRVYRSHGRFQEAVDMIKSSNLGMDSLSGAEKTELTKQYLELLEIREDWSELFGMCQTLLNGSLDPDPADPMYSYGELCNDWKIWRMAICANAKSDHAGFVNIPVPAIYSQRLSRVVNLNLIVGLTPSVNQVCTIIAMLDWLCSFSTPSKSMKLEEPKTNYCTLSSNISRTTVIGIPVSSISKTGCPILNSTGKQCYYTELPLSLKREAPSRRRIQL